MLHPSWKRTTAVGAGSFGTLVAAVQAARVARVKERKVPAHVADTNPAWPDKYNNILPIVTPWVYAMTMGEVKTADLRAAWAEMCNAQ